jgi:ubiquitin-conjugating enzyme E2 H
MFSSKGMLRECLVRRLMSDYEVNLVNDNMQEFFVRFYGPTESTYAILIAPLGLID